MPDNRVVAVRRDLLEHDAIWIEVLDVRTADRRPRLHAIDDCVRLDVERDDRRRVRERIGDRHGACIRILRHAGHADNRIRRT